MDELSSVMRRPVGRRDGRLMLALAIAVAALLGAANRLVVALRRSRMRHEMSALQLAAHLRRTDGERPRK